MASPLKRPAIVLDLAAFIGVSVFSISTEAPIIQQDILKRCQATLLLHHIDTKGLMVDGRDVVLSGGSGSLVVSSLARSAIESVNGVRVVRVKVLSEGQGATGSDDSLLGRFPSDHSSAGQFPADQFPADQALKPTTLGEVQEKIDRVLENQEIAFKADSTALTPEDEVVLDRVAAYLAEAPGLLCEIRGYDSEPLEMRQNWVLALQRSLATEDYLEIKGIADWRLSARVFRAGEGTPGRRGDHPVDLVVKTRE
jgi:outer membrane protein OmpA-like peptidoglycan-associated protein